VHALARWPPSCSSLLPYVHRRFSDMRIGGQGNRGNHKENLAGFFSSLFAHADAACPVAAGLEHGVKPEKRRKLLGRRKPLYGLDFEHQPNGGVVADSGDCLQQSDLRNGALPDHLLSLNQDSFFHVADLFCRSENRIDP